MKHDSNECVLARISQQSPRVLPGKSKANHISFIEDIEGDSDSIFVESDKALPIIYKYLKNTEYTPSRYELPAQGKL